MNIFLEVDPYPSPFDFCFVIGYGFMIAHISLNVKYFKSKLGIGTKAMLVLIPVFVTSIYITTAYLEWGEYEELPFDLFWGGMFALGSSTTLALAIVGVGVFRHSILKEVWLLLLAGIFLYMVSDVWYYYLETLEKYYSSHVVNTIWVAAFLVMTYALIKHRKGNLIYPDTKMRKMFRCGSCSAIFPVSEIEKHVRVYHFLR